MREGLTFVLAGATRLLERLSRTLVFISTAATFLLYSSAPSPMTRWLGIDDTWDRGEDIGLAIRSAGGLLTEAQGRAIQEAAESFELRILRGKVGGQERLVVLAGESHVKSEKARLRGEELLGAFPFRGVENFQMEGPLDRLVMLELRSVYSLAALLPALGHSTILDAVEGEKTCRDGGVGDGVGGGSRGGEAAAGADSTSCPRTIFLEEGHRRQGYENLALGFVALVLSSILFGLARVVIRLPRLLARAGSAAARAPRFLGEKLATGSLRGGLSTLKRILVAAHHAAHSPRRTWRFIRITARRRELSLARRRRDRKWHPKMLLGEILRLYILMAIFLFVLTPRLFWSSEALAWIYPAQSGLLYGRNITMAANVEKALVDGTVAASPLLVVCGAGHVPGIAELLEERGFEDLATRASGGE